MSHVKVKKVERLPNGSMNERVLVIKQSVWDRIRKENLSGVRYELMSSGEITEKQLMPTAMEMPEEATEKVSTKSKKK